MAQVETYRNVETGRVWSVNPGSEAHGIILRGIARGEFARVVSEPVAVSPPAPKPAPRKRATRKAAPKSAD